MSARLLLPCLACLTLAGCGEPANVETAATDPVANAAGTRPVPPRPIAPRPQAPVVNPTADAAQPIEQPAVSRAADAAGQNTDSGGRITADQYLEDKHQRRDGQRYSSNYVRTVVTAYDGFGIRDKVALDQAKKMLFAFETQFGRKPRTHEEAMQALEGCPLPELDDGCRYVYDPEQGELMVEHPE